MKIIRSFWRILMSLEFPLNSDRTFVSFTLSRVCFGNSFSWLIGKAKGIENFSGNVSDKDFHSVFWSQVLSTYCETRGLGASFKITLLINLEK